MKIWIAALLSTVALRAQASGCGGPAVSETGNVKVVSSVNKPFDLSTSRLACQLFENAPDWSFCYFTVDSVRYISIAKRTPKEMEEDFKIMNGRQVRIETVNVEMMEYDDCTGEETMPRWWEGKHRIYIGPGNPLYSPDEKNLPPF